MLWLYGIGGIISIVGISAFFGAPYLPSHRRDIRKLFDALQLGASDVVLDIGSGDGVVLREASRRGAAAVGYEIHPLFAGISRVLSRSDSRDSVRLVDAWRTPFPENVTLVYIFSVGRDGKKVARTVQNEANRLGRELRLVCYGNALPSKSVERTIGAYYQYRFRPLHSV